MAISVESLYQSIRDLARKDKAGYMANDEFNRNLVKAQQVIYDFYFEQFEDTQDVPEELRIFLETKTISSAAGLAPLPDDFEHVIRVRIKSPVYASDGCTIDSYSYSYALPINASEISLTQTSSIRKPSVSKSIWRYRTIGVSLQIFPEESYPVELEYLRAPVIPSRAVTIDSVNDEENYDSSSTVDLEWDASEENVFLDVMMYYYALPTRESEIIAWLGGKKATTQNLSEK